MKKIFDGFLFGIGFGIATLIISYVGLTGLVGSSLFESETFEVSTPKHPTNTFESTVPAREQPNKKELSLPFHELGIDDQIKHSTVIALAEYQPASDGSMRPVITDILKKEEGVEFFYEVGDEYARGTYYPSDRVLHGQGMVIFFTGSPAAMRSSMTYHGERISGLGDMPLKLLRKKCEAPAT